MSWSDHRQRRPLYWVLKQALPVAIYLTAAGCQPLPQPFAHAEKSVNPIVVPASDIGGVTVLPIWGLTGERGRGLTGAMSDALLEHGVIAGPDSSNRRSKFLQGAVTQTAKLGARTRVTIVWDLFDGGGKFLRSRETILTLPEKIWREPEQRPLQRLVRDAAAKIADMIRGDSGRTAANTGIALHVGKVDGISDKATAPLRHAMEAALKRRNFRIAKASDGARLVISGAIELGPENAEPRPIRITWWVLDKAGRELGKLTQQNSIERQELENRWDSLAMVIADNAAGGVSDLVVRLPRNVLRNHEKPAK